jgi:RNA 2',3'-cyclic 3'-phosphodiesterase
MKRIFIAVKIDPGDALLNMISDFRNTCRDEKIRWTESENFHITLAFLGDTAEEKIKVVGKMLKRVCKGSGAFDMVIKGAGVFKNIKDPRVIWTGIEPSEKLNQLHESIKTGLKEAGISLEERNFRPHLTLGRIKSIQDSDSLKTLIAGYSNLELQRQSVNEVILFESILSNIGPVYKPLEKIALVIE